MKANLGRTGGLIFSQHLLLLLIGKGLSRESAYRIVQRAAMKSIRSKMSFKELISADRAVIDRCSPEEIDEVFDIDSHLRRVDFIFARVLARRGRPKKS